MSNKKFATKCACLFFAVGGVATAAQADDTTYKSYPMAYMTLPDSSEPTLNVLGLIEPKYADSSEANLNNDFSFDRLRFGFNGSVSEKVDYFFMSEWAPNAITAGSSGGSKAFIAHLTFKDLIGDANVAVGSMAVPMGYSFFAPSTQAPWISYADIEYNLYGCGSIDCAASMDMPNNIFTNIWKPGVMVFDQLNFGSDSSLTYTLGAYNSTGTLFTDNRVESKDFNASLEYKYKDFMAMYGTRIGASKDVALWDDERDRTRHALTLMYNDFRSDRWWLWGEYMQGTDEQARGVEDVDASGYFLSAGFKPTPKTEVALRHSYFDPDESIGDNERTVNSVIGSYRMDNGIRIQAQYDIADEEDGFSGAIYPGDTFFVRVQMPFAFNVK